MSGILTLPFNVPALPVAFSLWPQTFLADISSLPWIAIIAVAGGMLVAIVVIVGGLIIAHHRQKLWHETARLALEKGQPLPPGPDQLISGQPIAPTAETARANRIRGYLIGGLINVAVGAGLYLGLSQISGALANFAAIPGFIGVALLLAGAADILLTRNPRA